MASHIKLLLILGISVPLAAMSAEQSPADETLSKLAVTNLQAVVANNRGLPRLHAAEDLILLGFSNPLPPDSEDPSRTASPFRIVFWRVQARASASQGQSSDRWIRSVVGVFLANPEAPDRDDAAETLGKLGYYPSSDGERAAFRRASREPGQVAVEALWVLANGGTESDEMALAEILKSPQPLLRSSAAYALRFRSRIQPAVHDLLLERARDEPAESTARAYIVSSALIHAEPLERPALLRTIEEYLLKGSPEDKFEAMNCLARAGDRSELPALQAYLEDPLRYDDARADLRVGAGNAILQIMRR